MEKRIYNQDQLEKIHLLQRLIRSFYVRRQFEQVRKEYLRTLSEIEGDVTIEPAVVTVEKVEEPAKPVAVVRPTREELLRKRDEIAVELLWLEQAIQSRKDFLRLKSRYTNSVHS